MVHHFRICVAEKKEHCEQKASAHIQIYVKRQLTQIPCAHSYICDYHLFQIQFDYLGLGGIHGAISYVYDKKQ